MSKINKWVKKKETGINRQLFEKLFKMQKPSDMLKTLYTTNDTKKNFDLVNLTKSRLSDLKNEIKNISEEEKKMKNQTRY